MNKCPNCGILLTCDCNIRPASDGTRVCGMCVADYEYALKTKTKQDLRKNFQTLRDIRITTEPDNLPGS